MRLRLREARRRIDLDASAIDAPARASAVSRAQVPNAITIRPKAAPIIASRKPCRRVPTRRRHSRSRRRSASVPTLRLRTGTALWPSAQPSSRLNTPTPASSCNRAALPWMETPTPPQAVGRPASGLVFGHGLSIKSGPTPQAYVSVRRLTQQIEHALYSRLAWAAFAPNGPPLWTQLRVAAANYLMGLYQSGVLVGSTPTRPSSFAAARRQ